MTDSRSYPEPAIVKAVPVHRRLRAAAWELTWSCGHVQTVPAAEIPSRIRDMLPRLGEEGLEIGATCHQCSGEPTHAG